MVPLVLRGDPTYPTQVSKGRRELESRDLPLLKLLNDSQTFLLLKIVGFSLKRENSAYFKNSNLTLWLKRGILAQARDSRSSENLTVSTVPKCHFSPRRDNSRSNDNPPNVQEADRPSEGYYIRSGIMVLLKDFVITNGTII
ncbi:hypothetical protein Lal_00036555 [Lupinus albus]|nr:hypothetical protein Lal_00036555 [Lupinus albus]